MKQQSREESRNTEGRGRGKGRRHGRGRGRNERGRGRGRSSRDRASGRGNEDKRTGSDEKQNGDKSLPSSLIKNQENIDVITNDDRKNDKQEKSKIFTSPTTKSEEKTTNDNIDASANAAINPPHRGKKRMVTRGELRADGTVRLSRTHHPGRSRGRGRGHSYHKQHE